MLGKNKVSVWYQFRMYEIRLVSPYSFKIQGILRVQTPKSYPDKEIIYYNSLQL